MISKVEPVAVEEFACGQKRKICSLNGMWEAQQSDYFNAADHISETFDNRIPVPGLWDMAEIPINSNSVWYQRTVVFKGEVSKVVRLKIGKAFWGKSVYVNGRHVADHQPNFTPAYLNITAFLRGNGYRNTLRIKTGAKGTQPREAGEPTGFDFEKHQYIPGIYDDVELILSGNPIIRYIQTAPKVSAGKVVVQVTLANAEDRPVKTDLSVKIFEKEAAVPVAEFTRKNVVVPAGSDFQVTGEADLPNAKLWSPETPYLYTVKVGTDEDESSCRFGMREFSFDASHGRAMLNGKPYALRGTNITMYRFFEDPARGSLPWNGEWARKVLLSFKRLNMNCMRFCIGFPPELWYELSDELGFLVDDEYPIWSRNELPDNVTDSIIPELTDWIRERANHPCVVVWDIQNETILSKTADIIHQMRERKIDLSDRPWDDGWAPPARASDSIECHPYMFNNPSFTLSELNRCCTDPGPYNDFAFHYTGDRDASSVPDNPRVINEYSWLWLNRDGSPTTLTRQLYENLLPGGSASERRDYFANALAELTEFWRAGKKAAGVVDFCGLTYCKPEGATCDYFLPNIEEPSFDPLFEERMSNAMAPVGVIIEEWSETQAPAKKKEFPVSILNDTDFPWEGEVTLTLWDDEKLFSTASERTRVPPYEKVTTRFSVMIPASAGTRFCLTAFFTDKNGRKISSVRYFRNGLPVPSPEVVSLSAGKHVAVTSSAREFDPDRLTYNSSSSVQSETNWWRSQTEGLLPEEINAQRVTVDLEKKMPVHEILITWGNQAAKEYAIEVSADGLHWETAYQGGNAKRGLSVQPVGKEARFVCLDLKESYDHSGYSIARLELF